MIEKWEATRRAAGRPATAPNAADATGTMDMACMTDMNRGGAFHRLRTAGRFTAVLSTRDTSAARLRGSE